MDHLSVVYFSFSFLNKEYWEEGKFSIFGKNKQKRKKMLEHVRWFENKQRKKNLVKGRKEKLLC